MQLCKCTLLALLPLLSAAEFATEDGVVVLTAHNFDDFLQANPIALVQFHTPWCGKCKAFESDWVKLASKAMQLERPVLLAKVDAKEHKEIADRFNVYGYPSIHTFHNGEGEDYEGKREVGAILEHIKNVASFEAPQQLSAQELERAAAVGQGVILGLFRQPVAASAAFKTFRETLWELARSGHAVKASYSASYAAPPIMPLTAEGKKPPVPSLVQLDATGKVAAKVMPLPRKKEDFTKEAVVEWLQSVGMKAKIEEKPNDYPEKDYSDPDEDPPEHDPDEDPPEHDDHDHHHYDDD